VDMFDDRRLVNHKQGGRGASSANINNSSASTIMWCPRCKDVSIRQLGGINAMLTRLSDVP